MSFLASKDAAGNFYCRFKLRDNAEDHDGKIKIQVKSVNGFLEISPEGYGECAAEDGHGSPIIIELYEGRLRLIVFGDINSEEPTHMIDLEGARESARTPEPTEDEQQECDTCGKTITGAGPTCPECLAIIIAHSVPEDEDEEGLTDPEPGEEDLITGDHVKFYEKGNEHRGPVVTVPEGEDWRRHVWDYMNSVNFWPSVWFISDHGNAHLMVLKSQDD